MWILCGLVSVLLCALGWIPAFRKSARMIWASSCSLAFVTLTLLLEYRWVAVWVNKEDWSALMDVIPSMSSSLITYVIIMLLANIGALFAISRIQQS